MLGRGWVRETPLWRGGAGKGWAPATFLYFVLSIPLSLNGLTVEGVVIGGVAFLVGLVIMGRFSRLPGTTSPKPTISPLPVLQDQWWIVYSLCPQKALNWTRIMHRFQDSSAPFAENSFPISHSKFCPVP